MFIKKIGMKKNKDGCCCYHSNEVVRKFLYVLLCYLVLVCWSDNNNNNNNNNKRYNNDNVGVVGGGFMVVLGFIIIPKPINHQHHHHHQPFLSISSSTKKTILLLSSTTTNSRDNHEGDNNNKDDTISTPYSVTTTTNSDTTLPRMDEQQPSSKRIYNSKKTTTTTTTTSRQQEPSQSQSQTVQVPKSTTTNGRYSTNENGNSQKNYNNNNNYNKQNNNNQQQQRSNRSSSSNSASGYYSNNNNNNNNNNRPRYNNNNENLTKNNNPPQFMDGSLYRNRSERDYANKQMNELIVKTDSAIELFTLLQYTMKGVLTSTCGGNLFNSVNFSTCIHRFARRSTTSKNDRAMILSDPRFALLVASLAEALISTTPTVTITTITTTTQKIKEDQNNDQTVVTPPPQIPFQSRELSNVAWALAKLQIAPPSSVMPMPDYDSIIKNHNNENNNEDITSLLLEPTVHQIRTYSQLVRQKVMEVAIVNRQQKEITTATNQNTGKEENDNDEAEQIQQQKNQQAAAAMWIPALSQLAGHVLDYVGALIIVQDIEQKQKQQKQQQQQEEEEEQLLVLESLQSTSTNTMETTDPVLVNGGGNTNNSSSSTTKKQRKPFRIQEWANLVWAWATCGRANSKVFGIVVRNMIRQQQEDQKKNNISTSSSTSSSAASNGTPDVLPQEWSNSIWAFATAQIYDGHEELLQFVAELMETRKDFVHDFKSQELSNTAWGIATLLSNKPATTTTTTQQQQLVGEQSTTIVGNSNQGQQQTVLTNAEQQASLTILRQIAASLLQREANGFRTQELSNTGWALATVGFGLKPTSDIALNNYVVLTSHQHEEDAKLMKDTINAIVKAALPLLGKFRSQELNNLTWTLARLVTQKSDILNQLLRGIGLQLADRRRSVTSQDVSTTSWGLATLAFADDEIYRGIASRLTIESGPNYKAQELSNTLWAFATAEIVVTEKDFFDTSLVPKSLRQRPPQDPIVKCFAIAAQELIRRPHQFKSQEIKDVLWSFSKVGIRHPKLFRSVAVHLVGTDSNDSAVNQVGPPRTLNEFSPQGIGNIAWAFARQAQLSEDVIERLNGNSALSNSNGRLAVYTTSFFDVGECLLQRFFASIAETDLRIHDNLRRCKPQDLSNTCWSFAVLGLKHTAFLDATKAEIINRTTRLVKGESNAMTLFKGQELANLIWSLATLNASAEDILGPLASYLREICFDPTRGKITVESISKCFKRQELANLAWACAVFGKYPPELMRILYTGLLGDEAKRNPVTMSSIHGDGGLQLQAIMTLVYVQAAMDLEGSSNGLTLPTNFPDGWQQNSANRNEHGDDLLIQDSFELNLSTSKVQRAVSSAFTRIGFDHVEELTITMEEMADVYGIKVTPKPMEILSIDIANSQDKVAIEVDGPAHYITIIDKPSDMKSGYTKLVNEKIEYYFGWNGEYQETNGPTFLKQRLLHLFGWETIHVPFWEWYALGGNATKEDEYCRRRLLEATERSQNS